MQTYELLRLALSGEECAFLVVPEQTFQRPPVRLVHEAVVACVQRLGCFDGQGGWPLRPEVQEYAAMTREHKVEFFEEVIMRVNRAFSDSGDAEGAVAKITAADILSGQRCEETNKLLQMLSYLSLGKNQQLGGLCDAAPQWVTAWRLQYFAEAAGWRWFSADVIEGVADEAQALLLEGSSDARTTRFVSLPRPVVTSRIRLRPIEWHRHPGIRCEVHVANVDMQLQCGKSERGSRRLQISAGLAARAVLELRRGLEDRQRVRSRQENDLKEQAAQERGDLERRLQEALARAEAAEARAATAEAALLKANADSTRAGSAEKQLEKELAAETAARIAAEERSAEGHKDIEELTDAVYDVTEQLLVMTDARDVFRAREEDLEEALAVSEDELASFQRSYMQLQNRFEEKELEEESADLLAGEMGEMTQELCKLQDAHDNAVCECGRLRGENQSLIQERDKLLRKKEKLEVKKAELVDKLQTSEKLRLAGRDRVMGILQQQQQHQRGSTGESRAMRASASDADIFFGTTEFGQHSHRSGRGESPYSHGSPAGRSEHSRVPTSMK